MDDWWVDFVAGWVSGAAGVVACQPLDTILTRYQATSRRLVAGSAAAGTANTAFLSPWSSAAGLVRSYGVLSLWRGSSPMIGAVPVQNALLMGGYGLGKRYSEQTGSGNANAGSNQRHDFLPVFVGGCFGGILQSFLMSPVEWIKVRQQTAAATATTNSTAATSSTGYLLRTLFRHKSTLWNRGLAAALLRDGIPHGVWFASYELCKTELVALHRRGVVGEEHDDEHKHAWSSSFFESVAVPLVSGAFAAATAWAVGYPFDIIKTRIQATTTNAAANPAATASAAGSGTAVPGVAETARQLVREANGNVLRGLYRGFGWKLVRSIPASMIGFLTYEVVSKGISKPQQTPGV